MVTIMVRLKRFESRADDWLRIQKNNVIGVGLSTKIECSEYICLR